MVHQLRAHTSLAENPNLIPSSPVRWFTTTDNTSSRGTSHLWCPQALTLTYTYPDTEHTSVTRVLGLNLCPDPAWFHHRDLFFPKTLSLYLRHSGPLRFSTALDCFLSCSKWLLQVRHSCGPCPISGCLSLTAGSTGEKKNLP